jgi:hypothetical protein
MCFTQRTPHPQLGTQLAYGYIEIHIIHDRQGALIDTSTTFLKTEALTDKTLL